ncbi:unnamed protein product, partial [Vitis vinifera]
MFPCSADGFPGQVFRFHAWKMLSSLPVAFLMFNSTLTYNCLTTRESMLVSIHVRNMTVYRRALYRYHTIFTSRMAYIFTLFFSCTS